MLKLFYWAIILVNRLSLQGWYQGKIHRPIQKVVGK